MAEAVNIKHVFGNPLQIAIPLTQRIRTLEDGQEIERTEDFFPYGDVKAVLRSNIRTYEYIATMERNVAIITDDKGDVSSGVYGVTITCLDQEGKPRRFAMANAIKIVTYTADAGIEAGVEFNVETYTLEGAVFFYAKGDKGDSGEKGDPFTYEDFTPTQIAELQKPAIDAAHMVDETLSHYIGNVITDITDIL